MFCPGPDNRKMSEVYLQMLSHDTPNVGTWEFSATEPWDVLSSILESAVTEEDGNQLEESGPVLALRFLENVCHQDLDSYLAYSLAKDRLGSDYRPLLARILCPSGSTSFSGNMKFLCKFYCRAVAKGVPALASIRSLLGLASQILQLKERNLTDNSNKEEMAKFLAFELQKLELSASCEWSQLYMLEPAWLSALVSRARLFLVTNTKPHRLSLRPLLTSLAGPPHISSLTEENENLVAANTNNNQAEEGSQQQVKFAKSDYKKLPSKRLDVHKKNKYGETLVHTAAKKGNILKLRECLATPGVDINCVDNNGYTPLSEAVHRNKVEAVRLLLEHKPQSRGSKNQKRSERVDILIKNQEDQSNAFHEAVELERSEIVKLILETVQEEESNALSGLPSLVDLFEAENRDGETVMTMPTTEEMKQMLDRFCPVKQEEKDLSECKIKQVEVRLVKLPNSARIFPKTYVPLLELAITQYIRSNSLDSVYSTFRTTKLENLLHAVDHGQSKDNTGQNIVFAGGFQKLMFGSRPRFDIYRSEKTKVQDLRDFESLIRRNTDANSPLARLFIMNSNVTD